MADMDVSMGRGPQVIKVVMPTYIMAPTENERFRRKKTCHIIAECLKRKLDGKEFDESDAKAWSASTADAVKARIHAECSAARYKIVVQTFIGQQRLQDVRITSRCLWDNDHDNHASAVFNSVRSSVRTRALRAFTRCFILILLSLCCRCVCVHSNTSGRRVVFGFYAD